MSCLLRYSTWNQLWKNQIKLCFSIWRDIWTQGTVWGEKH